MDSDDDFIAVNEDDLTSVEFSDESEKEIVPIYEHHDEDTDEYLFVGNRLVTSTRRVREELGTVYLPPLIKKPIHTYISEYNSNPILKKLYKTISNNLSQEHTPYNHLPALLLADEHGIENKVLYTFGDETNGLVSWQFAFGLGVKHLHVFGTERGSWINTVEGIFIGAPQPMVHFEPEVFPLESDAVVVVFDRKGVDQFRSFCASSFPYSLSNMIGNTVIVSLLDEALLDPATGKVVAQCDFINLNLAQEQLYQILAREEREASETSQEISINRLLMYLVQYVPGISKSEQARSSAVFTCVNREQMLANLSKARAFFNSSSEKQYTLIKWFELPHDRKKTLLNSLGKIDNVEINKHYAALLNVASGKMIANSIPDQIDVAITGGIGSLLCGLYVTHKIPVFLICTNLLTYSCCMAKLIMLKSFTHEEFIKIYVHVSPLMFYHLQPKAICPVKGRPFINAIPRIARKISHSLSEGTSAIIRRVYLDKNVLSPDNIMAFMEQTNQVQFFSILHDPMYFNSQSRYLAINDTLTPNMVPEGYKSSDFNYTEKTEGGSTEPGRMLVYTNAEYEYISKDIIDPNSSFDMSSQLTIYSLADTLSSSLSSIIESNSISISYLAPGSIHIDLTTEEEHSLLDLERFMAESPGGDVPESTPRVDDPIFKLPGTQMVPPDIPISKNSALDRIVFMSEDVGDPEILNNPETSIVIGDNMDIVDDDDGFFAEPVESEISLTNNPIVNSDTVRNIKQQKPRRIAPELLPMNVRELDVLEIQFIDRISNTLFPSDEEGFIITQRVFKEVMRQTFFTKGPNTISATTFADTIVKVCLMRPTAEEANYHLRSFITTIVGHNNIPHIDINSVQDSPYYVHTFFKVITRMLFETVVSAVKDNWSNNKLSLTTEEVAYYNIVQQFPTAIGSLFESDLESTKDLIDKVYNLYLSSKRRWSKYKETFKKSFSQANARLKLSESALPPKTHKVIEFLELFLPAAVSKVFTGTNKKRIISVIETNQIDASQKYLLLQHKYLERFISAFASKNALKNEINTWFSTKQRVISINDKKYKTDYNLMELANYFLKRKHIETEFYLLDRNNTNTASDIRYKLFKNIRDVIADEKKKRGPKPPKKTKRTNEDVVLESVKKARKEDNTPIFITPSTLSQVETINVCTEVVSIVSPIRMPDSPLSASELRQIQSNILSSSLSDHIDSNPSTAAEPQIEMINEGPVVMLEDITLTPIKPVQRPVSEDVPTVLVPDTNVTALVVAVNQEKEEATQKNQAISIEQQRILLEKKAAWRKRRNEKTSRRLAALAKFVPHPKVHYIPERNLPSVMLTELLGRIETKWSEIVLSGNVTEAALVAAAQAEIESPDFKPLYLKSRFGNIDEYYNERISYYTKDGILYAVSHLGDFNIREEGGEIEENVEESDDEFDEDEEYETFDEVEYITGNEYNLMITLYDLVFVTFSKYQVSREILSQEVQETLSRCADVVRDQIKAIEAERKAIQDKESDDTVYNHMTLNGKQILLYRNSINPKILAASNKPTEEIINVMLKGYETYGHPLETRIIEIQARRNYQMSLQYAPLFQFFGKRQKAIKSTMNYDLLLGAINKAMIAEGGRELELELLLMNINLMVFHPTRKALVSTSFYNIEDLEDENTTDPDEPEKTAPYARIAFDPKATDTEKVIQILIQEKAKVRNRSAKAQLTSSASEPPISTTPGYDPESAPTAPRVDILQNYNLITNPLTLDSFAMWIANEEPASLIDILQRIRTVRQNFNVSAFVGVNLRELRARAKSVTVEDIKAYNLSQYDLLIKWYEDFVKRYTFNASLLETETRLDLTRYTRWQLNISPGDMTPVQQGLQNLVKTMNLPSEDIINLGLFGGDIYRKIFYYTTVPGSQSAKIVAYYKKVFNASMLYKRVKKVIDNVYQVYWSPSLSVIHPGWMTLLNEKPTLEAETNALILFYLQFLRVFEKNRTTFDAKTLSTVCELLTLICTTRFVGIYDEELVNFLLKINCSDFKSLHRHIWKDTTNPYAYTTYKNLLTYYEQSLSASCGIGSDVPDNNFGECNDLYKKYRLLVLRALEYVRTGIEVMKQINERLLLNTLVGDYVLENKEIVYDIMPVTESNKQIMAGTYADAFERREDNRTEQKDAANLYLLVYEKNKSKYQLSNKETMRKKLSALRLNAQNMMTKLLYIGTAPTELLSDTGYMIAVNSILGDSDWLAANESKIESIKNDLSNLFASATLPMEKEAVFDPTFAMRIMRESLKPSFMNLGFALQNSVTIAQAFTSEMILDGGTDSIQQQAEQKLRAFARRVHDTSLPQDQRVIIKKGGPLHFRRIYVKNNPLYAKGTETTVLRLF